ncbi:hypothetical protein P7C70_g521, partial [Phenoliferia sp. Uapishka_3]
MGPTQVIARRPSSAPQFEACKYAIRRRTQAVKVRHPGVGTLAELELSHFFLSSHPPGQFLPRLQTTQDFKMAPKRAGSSTTTQSQRSTTQPEECATQKLSKLIQRFEKSMKKYEIAMQIFNADDTPLNRIGPHNDPGHAVDEQEKETMDVIREVLGEAAALASAEVARAGGDVTGDEIKEILDDIVNFERRAVDAVYGKDWGQDSDLASMCDSLETFTKPVINAPLGGSAGLIGTLGPLMAEIAAERGTAMPDWDKVPNGGMFVPSPPYDPTTRPSSHSTPLAKFFTAKPVTPPSKHPLIRNLFEARCEVTSRRIATPYRVIASPLKVFACGAGGSQHRYPTLTIWNNSFKPCLCPKVAVTDKNFDLCLDGIDDLVAVGDSSSLKTYRADEGVHTIDSRKYGGAMTFLQGGKKLARASAHQGVVGVWDLDGKKSGRLEGVTSSLTLDSSIKGISMWTPLVNSTDFICTSNETLGVSSGIFELDWTTGQKRMRYVGHGGTITGLSTAEGRENDFLTSCSDGVTRLFDRRTPQPTLSFAIKEAEEEGCASALANIGGLPFVFAGGTRTEQISAYDARLPGKPFYSLATGNNAVRSMAWQASTNSLWAATEWMWADGSGAHHGGYRRPENVKAPPGCNWPGTAYHNEKSFGYTFDAASHQLFRFTFKDAADPKVLPVWGQSKLGGSTLPRAGRDY